MNWNTIKLKLSVTYHFDIKANPCDYDVGLLVNRQYEIDENNYHKMYGCHYLGMGDLLERNKIQSKSSQHQILSANCHFEKKSTNVIMMYRSTKNANRKYLSKYKRTLLFRNVRFAWVKKTTKQNFITSDTFNETYL